MDATASYEPEHVSTPGGQSLVLMLARELASNLATPIYIADADERLVYFNEAAEEIAGQSFPETGRIPIAEWVALLAPSTTDGVPLRREQMPGGIASLERRPAHASLRVTGLDGRAREIATTAFPLLGPDGAFHGVMVIFWEHA